MRPRLPIVLIVEDDPAIAELLGTMLPPLGAEVVHAADGAQAQAALERVRPSVITLDLVLPDLDGMELLERVRSRPDLDDVPVIAVTARADSATMRRAYAAGVSDFVPKPFSLDLFEAKLRVFLRLHRMADQLREHERFLIDVLERHASGVAVCDADGRVVRMNAAAAHQLGLGDVTAGVGQTLGEIASGADVLGKPTGGGAAEAIVETPRGPRRLGYTTGALDDGAMVTVFRELDAAEAAERDAATRRRLEALTKAARTFVHEVRNPLAAVGAAAQLLGRADLSAEMRLRLSQAVQGEVERIDRMVREYVELQAPPAATAPIDIAALVGEAVELNLLASSARGRVRVRTRPVPTLHGDAARLKQVILNLLINAIAATEAGGEIEIGVEPGERGAVIVRVIDSGEGIAAEDLPRIFEEDFSRRGSFGLGLPLARRIVEEHGGRMTVESAKGGGTTVTVTLPTGPTGQTESTSS